MKTSEVAKDFTDMLRSGDHAGAGAKYNADDIASYEQPDQPMAVASGKDAVREKGEWWSDNHEVHDGSVQGPYVNGDQFAVHFMFDITPKSTGERIKMNEVGVYTVKDGKIVEERFYY